MSVTSGKVWLDSRVAFRGWSQRGSGLAGTSPLVTTTRGYAVAKRALDAMRSAAIPEDAGAAKPCWRQRLASCLRLRWYSSG